MKQKDNFRFPPRLLQTWKRNQTFTWQYEKIRLGIWEIRLCRLRLHGYDPIIIFFLTHQYLRNNVNTPRFVIRAQLSCFEDSGGWNRRRLDDERINKCARTMIRLELTFWDILGYFGIFWDNLGQFGRLFEELGGFGLFSYSFPTIIIP